MEAGQEREKGRSEENSEKREEREGEGEGETTEAAPAHSAQRDSEREEQAQASAGGHAPILPTKFMLPRLFLDVELRLPSWLTECVLRNHPVSSSNLSPFLLSGLCIFFFWLLGSLGAFSFGFQQ